MIVKHREWRACIKFIRRLDSRKLIGKIPPYQSIGIVPKENPAKYRVFLLD